MQKQTEYVVKLIGSRWWTYQIDPTGMEHPVAWFYEESSALEDICQRKEDASAERTNAKTSSEDGSAFNHHDGIRDGY
jgi:hypothetical protein